MNLGRPISILDFPGSLWTDASAPGRELKGKMYVDGVCMHACVWGMAYVALCVCVYVCVCVCVYTCTGICGWEMEVGWAFWEGRDWGHLQTQYVSLDSLQAGSITCNQSLRGFMSLNGREAGSVGNTELGP